MTTTTSWRSVRLNLSAASLLLDVGTGRGWPGLYLSATTGCALVGTDMPHHALADGVRRAERDHIVNRVSMVVAGGASQPFRWQSFDAIVMTDVLC